MKPALKSLLIAGILSPAAAPAQSITPTRTTILLYETAGGFVIGAEKRVYTSYYNTLRTRYIGVEVTLDYPAAAAGFQLAIGCHRLRLVHGMHRTSDEKWAAADGPHLRR